VRRLEGDAKVGVGTCEFWDGTRLGVDLGGGHVIMANSLEPQDGRQRAGRRDVVRTGGATVSIENPHSGRKPTYWLRKPGEARAHVKNIRRAFLAVGS